MLSSKCTRIYPFFMLIIINNLVIEANSNNPESKANFSLVYLTANQDNTTNQSYKTFNHTNLNKINNTSSHFLNHSIVNQTDLQAEMALLKRIRRRISMKSNASSHRNSHQDAHKLVDRCARKKTSRRNPKLQVHDSIRKNDTSKKQSHMKGKKQGKKSPVLLNRKKIKNLTNIAPLKNYVKHPGSLNNPYITKNQNGKVHGVNKANMNNLSRNSILNNKSGVKGKNRHRFVGRVFPSVKGGKHSPVKEIAAIKHLHESSKNKISSKNKRINIHSSDKRINSIQIQKKDKVHKNFKTAATKLNASMGETEYTLKNDDSIKFNSNRDRENTGKITDEERYTSKSHLLKLKKNGLEDKKNLSESGKLEKAAIPFRDQYSKGVKDNLLKTHKKSNEGHGKKHYENETTTENSLKIEKVRRKAVHLRNSRATLQKVSAHDALSRIRKHSYPKSLKRNTRDEKNIVYDVKDFIVNHFPKKRDEQVVKSSLIHRNIHRETRNTYDDNSDNTSRMSRNNLPDFKVKNENSKFLEEIRDFVVKNYHIGKKKRNPLVQQNLIPLARSVRSSKNYKNHSSHAALRSKNNVPWKIQANSFMNAIEKSDDFWGDLQGIVKRKTETNSISEAVGNFTVSEYDDADYAHVTEVYTDVHPQIIKKRDNANNSVFETTRQSAEENDKSDSDLELDQYNENSSGLTTNEESPTENEGTTTDFLSTEVTSDEVSVTEGNLESNADGKNDSNDQDNVSESPDSSSLPNDDGISEVISKHLIEREISTVTNHFLVSSEEAQSSLSNTFSEMSDITTFTSSPVTSTFSKSDSTTYENTTPLSTELSSTESKDVTSVDSKTEWNSESSLPSSTYTEGQENSVETSSVLSSTYSNSEESSSVTSTYKVQTSLETRAPKVYRHVQYVKEVEDEYEDRTLSDASTSDTFEEQEYTNTMGRLKRIQNISTLERNGNKANNKDKEYKLFTITETTSQSMNKFDNIKISSNYIRKHGGKSQMKQNNYDPERLASNMNKNAQKSQLHSKEESLSNAENENKYAEETVSEGTRQVLTATTESGKEEYIRFGNIKEGHTNLKEYQKKKSHALGNDNIKISNNYIRKHGGKSQTKLQENYDPNRLTSNMNRNAQNSRLHSVKVQKEESLSNAESENEYAEETVPEGTKQVLTTTTKSGKGEYIKFRNIKEGHTNLKEYQKKKSHALGKEPQKFVNSDVYNQDGEDVSKSTIQDLTLNTERSKAFANTKGKRVNSNIIPQGNYKSLGTEFHTLTNLSPNSLGSTEEESSSIKNKNHTYGSSKPAIQDEIEDSDEDDYEFQTEYLQVSTATSVSNKVYRKPKEGVANLKSMPDVGESVDEALDYLRNGTLKAEAVPKNTMLNNPAVNDDEYEDSSNATSPISTTETLETTPKSRIPKEYKNRLNKGEKLSNHGFEVYPKSNKLQMTTLSEMQPFDDEMLPQTDKPLKEIAGDIEEKESDRSLNESISGQKPEENWIRKPTITPNKKLKSSFKFLQLSLNLKKQGNDEQEEIESTTKKAESDQTFATYFVTLQNAKIMPDETTTSSTQSTYSDTPRAHESLSRLESIINDVGEEYYDEVAHNNENGERISKHVSSDKEMKSSGDKARVENGTVGQGKFDYDEDGMNDVETSSYAHKTIAYSTASDGLESSTSEETTINDYELGVSDVESVTETPEHVQKNSVTKTAGKDKEFVRHLSSLISHLKQRRKKSHLESMNHRISRRARAVVTSEPTPKSKLSQVRMPPAKEWWIGGGGIVIMGLLIIGMYHTVIKVFKRKRVWEKSTEKKGFHAVLHRYEADDEVEDRMSGDVLVLQNFIDQIMQKHEISEDGSVKEEYSTAEHLSRIHAATIGTID